MTLRLTFLESLGARLNVLPTPLLDTPLAPGMGKALVTACELGIFDALDGTTLKLETLAEKVDCHPQGLKLLLQLLVSSGYLRCWNDTYTNAPLAQRWLVSRSPRCIAPYILHAPDIVNIWDNLPSLVRTNQPAMSLPYTDELMSEEAEQMLARHYAGLAALAAAFGGEITRHARLPRGAQRLLDVGGSHAGYSALYCQRNPCLHATILDLPSGLQAGRVTAKRAHLEDRMSFVHADIVRDDFVQVVPDSFDVALYFHVAHLLQPEINQAVLAKVARVLKPGGMLLFLDQITDQSHGSQLSSLMVQLMTLTMHTTGGTCYPFAVVKDWLEQAGLQRVRKHRLLLPGATLISAIKAR